jgi:hypothetical protein
MNLIQLVMEPFDAQPEKHSLLWAKMQIFVTASASNVTQVNMANWWEIYNELIRSRGSSVLWFFPAAGSTLVTLAILSLIKGGPQDALECASISSRIFVGVGTMLLSLLDINSSKPIFDANGNPTSSMIWLLDWSNWVLPLFALGVGSLLLIEILLAFIANREYYHFDGLPFRKGDRRSNHRRPLHLLQSSYESSQRPLLTEPMTA